MSNIHSLHVPNAATGGTAIRLALLLLCVRLASCGAEDYTRRVEQVLLRTPLIDGHNDLPWEIRNRFKSDLTAVDLKSDTTRLAAPGASPLMTDIPRMRVDRK